jgi:hypothetical protein
MAIVTYAISFQSAAGDPIAFGSCTFRLSQDIASGSNQLAAGRIVTIALDANGSAVPSLFPATYEVVCYTAQGQPVWSGEAVVTSGGTAVTPTFDPPAGSYVGTQQIEPLASGAYGFYVTTDGSTPTPINGTFVLAGGTVTVSTSETVQAIAIEVGFQVSAVGSAAYVISLPTQATPTFSPVAGGYTAAQNVTITSSGADAIYYTTDGSTPSRSSTLYTSAVTVGVSETLKALAIRAGYNDSTVGSAAYVLTQPTPTFSPVAGSYSGTQSVTITSSGADAIYYTTDGSTPTTGSTPYSGAITVASTQTVKALAVKSGWTNSAVGSATYTLPIIQLASVYGTNTTSSDPTSATATLDSTGANFIAVVVNVICDSSSGITMAVTDNKGNTYHALTKNAWVPPINPAATQMFYAYNATTGSGHVITATGTTGGTVLNEVALVATAFAGVKSVSDPFESGTDLSATTYPVAGTTIQAGAVSAANVGDLIFAALALDTGFTTSIDSGFTGIVPVNISNELVAYLLAPNTSPINPTWTYSSAQSYPAANIAVFKHA